jgi:hypothetical protein
MKNKRLESFEGHGPTDSLEPFELQTARRSCSTAAPITTSSYLIIMMFMCIHGLNFVLCVHTNNISLMLE